MLPAIADALKGDTPIIMDSGIRRGTDIAKALAFGANAVAVGHPVMYGLTVAGPGGVNGVMSYFHRELVNTMLHCGVDKISSLGRQHIAASATARQ